MTNADALRSWLDQIAAFDTRPDPLRAVALVSGGLDSMLAVRLMQEQGVEVVPVNFNTRCSSAEFAHRLRLASAPAGETPPGPPVSDEVSKASEQLGLPVQSVPVDADYLKLLVRPRHGYGAAANPCVDCRIYLFRRALHLLVEHRAHFLVTGEVLGQRPKSQTKHALKVIDNMSDTAQWVLRPLSAQMLEPTLPEAKGWIDRARLLDVTGRARKVQLGLAEEYGFADNPQPAGGCAYVEQAFANRFFDFLKHNADDAFGFDDITLLRIGRHFRISPEVKVIVGRDADQNAVLRTWQLRHAVMMGEGVNGPVALIDLRRDLRVAALADAEDDLCGRVWPAVEQAAAVLLRYADVPADSAATVRIDIPVADGEIATRRITASPMADELVQDMALVDTARRNSFRTGRSRFDRDAVPSASLAAIDHRMEREHHKRRPAGPA